MALLDLFYSVGPRPGWMKRRWGRPFVEVCLVAADIIVEGVYQARLAILGVDPPEDAIKYIERDRRMVRGVKETRQVYMTRARRWHWSHRAAGLAGVANLIVDPTTFGGSALPFQVSGTPTETGYRIQVTVGGTVGIAGIFYKASLDGGATYTPAMALGTSTSISIGDVTVEWHSGALLNPGTLNLDHGGFGLIFNDLGAAQRGGDPGGSPAGPEGILHEIASLRAPDPPRMKLISADGTWWIREKNGYVWRIFGAPWAWEADKDADPTWWARGILVFDEEDYVPWPEFGIEEHVLGEPWAMFGTTSDTEFWRQFAVTWDFFGPTVMRLESVIFNYDPTKFDPSDASTCPDGTWYNTAIYDIDGNVTASRPLDYAWYSTPFPY